MVFGMRASQDDPVIFDQVIAFGVQVFIGDDVILDRLMVEPIEEMRVGVVLPQRRSMAAEPRMIARGEIKDRPEPA